MKYLAQHVNEKDILQAAGSRDDPLQLHLFEELGVTKKSNTVQ